MTKQEAEQTIRAHARTCRGPLAPEVATVKQALLAQGDHEGAAVVDRTGRTACGADFNDIICAGPFDGQKHAYTCPQCGVTGVYQAPLLAVEG